MPRVRVTSEDCGVEGLHEQLVRDVTGTPGPHGRREEDDRGFGGGGDRVLVALEGRGAGLHEAHARRGAGQGEAVADPGFGSHGRPSRETR